MYSYKPLPLEVRTSFDLQAWPYNDRHKHLFIDYMKSLTVFRYEDDETEDGSRIIAYPINIEKPTGDKPFEAYYSSCAVSNKNLSIIAWPNDKPEGQDLMDMIDLHPIGKDRKAWFEWNIPVNVLSWTNSMIVRKEITSKIDNCAVSRGCSEYEVGKIVRETGES
jgi:hypothetical protein